MDPDANLAELREVARAILRTWDACDPDDGSLTEGQQEFIVEQANRLAELVEALDEWLARAGFLPMRWRT
jgi:hypothetical protein